MEIDIRRILTVVAASTLVAGLAIQPAAAEDEERRVIKKVVVECDGDECDEHEHAEGSHAFAWSSSDRPHRFKFRTHVGGGFLGVQLAELTPELRAHFGVPEDAGVMVSKVIDDSPAAKAGLLVGDIITAVEGERVGSGNQLGGSVRSRKEGDVVLLEVWRDGSMHNLTATVTERQTPAHGTEWAFVVECQDDGGEDCSFARKRLHAGGDWDVDFDCGGDGPCDVKVQCEDGNDCVCTVNGEETECSELPGFDD